MVALVISNVAWMVNMTTLLVILIGLAFVATVTWLRIIVAQRLARRQPPDTRLDTLITNMATLTEKVDAVCKYAMQRGCPRTYHHYETRQKHSMRQRYYSRR